MVTAVVIIGRASSLQQIIPPRRGDPSCEVAEAHLGRGAELDRGPALGDVAGDAGWGRLHGGPCTTKATAHVDDPSEHGGRVALLVLGHDLLLGDPVLRALQVGGEAVGDADEAEASGLPQDINSRPVGLHGCLKGQK